MNKPKKVWGNGINMSGIWFPRPRVFTPIPSLSGYWSRSGAVHISKVGLDSRNGLVTFASENKEEVEFWTKGAKAMAELVSRLTRTK